MNRFIMRAARGFSLIELMIAGIFLSLALLSFLWMNSFSSRSTMDVKVEQMIFQLAREPIEFVKSKGFNWIHGTSRKPEMNDFIRTLETLSPVDYPAETAHFRRSVEIRPGPVREGVPNYYSVTVTIRKARDSSLGSPETLLQGAIWRIP